MVEQVAQLRTEGYKIPFNLDLQSGNIVKTRGGYLRIFFENGRSLQMQRYVMQTLLNRKLDESERVRFKTKDKRNYLPENLKLCSGVASAPELLEINKEPILGYTHCLCKCGGELDVSLQKEHPHAYLNGHSPSDKRRAKTQAAALGKEIPTDRQLPELVLTESAPGEPAQIQEVFHPPETYREIFQAAIKAMSWEQFQLLIPTIESIYLQNSKES